MINAIGTIKIWTVLPFGTVETLIIILWLNAVLHRKYSKKKTIAVFLVACSVLYCIPAAKLLSKTPMVVGLYVVGFVCVMLLFRDSMRRKVLCYAVCLLLRNIPEYLVLILLYMLGLNGFTVDIMTIYVPTLLFVYMVYIVLLQIMKRVLNRESVLRDAREMLPVVVVLTCETVLYCWFAGTMAMDKGQISYERLYSFVVISLAITSITLLFLMFSVEKISRSAQTRMQNDFLKQQQTTQLAHYRALNQQVTDMRKLRHDVMNHLSTMELLFTQGHYEQARENAAAMEKRMEGMETLYYCDNQIVNAVLYNKVLQAHDKGIEVDIRVQLHADFPMESTDLIALFSNLLDNAIEAASMAEHKEIAIFDRVAAGFYTLTVRNTKPETPTLFVDKLPQTSKADKQNHGMGTRILTEIAERFDGTIQFHDMGKEFTTTIMLQQ